MKSKRKQVNKYKTKGEENLQQKEQDSLKRTIGNKPFQLNKLRVAKRHNLDALAGKVNLDLLKKKLTQEDMLLEQGDVYLNLVIQKKLIIDNQHNQKLESERKSLIYLDYQNDLYPDVLGSLQENNKTEEMEVEGKDESVFAKHQSLDRLDGIPQKKKLKKCQCCQHINGYQSKAIICHINDDNLLNQSLGVNQITPEAEIKQPASQQSSELKTAATNHPFVPPYTFTSMKWRSKSEMLQVDKWKEKYGRPDYSKSIEKIKNQEQRSIVTVFEKKFHEDDRKGKIIRLKNQREHNLQKQGEKFAPLPSLKQSASMMKIKEKKKSYNDVMPTKDTIQSKANDSQELESKEKKVQKQIQEYNSTHKIVIKKMFSEERASDEPESATINPQQEEPKIEKKQKRSKKKNKFPEIQISTFYSARETDQERKKMSKMFTIQRAQNEWKQKPPKKIFLEKMMEEIPQRWEYGESRDSNRSEMGFYMRFKKDEELRQLKEAENMMIIKISEGSSSISELQTL